MKNLIKSKSSLILIHVPKSIVLFVLRDFIILSFKNGQIAINTANKQNKVMAFINCNHLCLLNLSNGRRKDSYLLQLQKYIFCTIEGISSLYSKRLSLVGVGFRCWLVKKRDLQLILKVGFSNDILILIPKNILIFVLRNTELLIRGIDKNFVNNFASFIRNQNPPEPYKLKGIQIQSLKCLKVKKLSKN